MVSKKQRKAKIEKGKKFTPDNIAKRKQIDIDLTSTSATTFLDLPAEIRNRISELVLVKEDPIFIPLYLRTPKSVPPPLSRTSRQIRAETIPIYYGLNTFRLNVEAGFSRRRAQHPASIISRLHLLQNIDFDLCHHGNRFLLRKDGSSSWWRVQMVFREDWDSLHPHHCKVRRDRQIACQATLDSSPLGLGSTPRSNVETFAKLTMDLGRYARA